MLRNKEFLATKKIEGKTSKPTKTKTKQHVGSVLESAAGGGGVGMPAVGDRGGAAEGVRGAQRGGGGGVGGVDGDRERRGPAAGGAGVHGVRGGAQREGCRGAAAGGARQQPPGAHGVRRDEG